MSVWRTARKLTGTASFRLGPPDNTSTFVIAGAPGSFDKDVPANLAELNSLGIGSGPFWSLGQYVVLGDGSEAYWDTTMFEQGRSRGVRTVSTVVTSGAPGTFNNDVPATTAELNSLNIGTGAAWTPGQYVQASNGELSYWDGRYCSGQSAGSRGEPVDRGHRRGSPGSFNGDVPGDLATLLALGIGAGAAWSPGQHVFLGSGLSVYWDGTTFRPGKAPAAVPSPSTTVTEGAPGAFDNDVPATIDALVALGIGSGPLWGVGATWPWATAAWCTGTAPRSSRASRRSDPLSQPLVAPKINGIANGVAEVTGTFTHTPGVWYGALLSPCSTAGTSTRRAVRPLRSVPSPPTPR